MSERAAPTVATTTDHPIGEIGVDRLNTRLIWAYAAPRTGISILGLLFTTYLLKFSTDVLLIAPAAMGTLIAVSRFWDAISDPMVGYLSDNTNSRFGRRRIWLYGAALPTAIGMIMIWSPPTNLDAVQMIIWMAVALIMYETASTCFFVPHGALGVELTPNYHERTRLFGYVHMISASGLILGLIALQLMNMSEDKRTFATYLSVFAGVTVGSLILWTTWLLPERQDFQGRDGASIFKSFGDILRNKHAALLLMMYFIETFGVSSVLVLVPYLTEYVLPMKEYMVVVMLCYVIPQFAFTPFFIALSKRIGKKALWAIAMWGLAVTFIAAFFFLIPGEFSYLIFPGTFMLGIAAGAAAVAGPAIKADIIDYDEYLTHERKEGAYYAAWNLIRKTSASLAIFATGLALQFSGFAPNEAQSAETQVAILALFSLLPGFCYVIGAMIFMRFSFNEAEHSEVREALEARKQ